LSIKRNVFAAAPTGADIAGAGAISHARMQRMQAAIQADHLSAAPAEGKNQTAAAMEKLLRPNRFRRPGGNETGD
jgi:hypothetical protein